MKQTSVYDKCYGEPIHESLLIPIGHMDMHKLDSVYDELYRILSFADFTTIVFSSFRDRARRKFDYSDNYLNSLIHRYLRKKCEYYSNGTNAYYIDSNLRERKVLVEKEYRPMEFNAENMRRLANKRK